VTALVVVLAVTVALLTVLVCGLLRSHAEILRALHALGADLDPAAGGRRPAPQPLPVSRPGAPAHDLVGVDRDGNPVAVGVLGAAHRTLLAFLSTGCTTCRSLWAALPGGVPLPEATRLVVVVQDLEQESPAALAALDTGSTPLVASTAAWRDYAVPGSPHFVLVDGPTGRVVGDGAAAGWGQVADLAGQAVADAVPATPARDNAARDNAARDNAAPDNAARDNAARDNAARDNAARVDAELAAHGIGPGHPSLYPRPVADR
jgi:hypothetical protein